MRRFRFATRFAMWCTIGLRFGLLVGLPWAFAAAEADPPGGLPTLGDVLGEVGEGTI